MLRVCRCCNRHVLWSFFSHWNLKGVKLSPRLQRLDDTAPRPRLRSNLTKNTIAPLTLPSALNSPRAPPPSPPRTPPLASPLRDHPCPFRCVASSPSSSSASGGGGGGGGGWAAPQFRRWLASYLRELKTSPEPVHRALVLRSARPLLEADPALGLSVFLDQQRQGPHHGRLVQRRGGGVQSGRRAGVGAGMGGGGAADGRRTEGRLAPHDVVSFLKAITPSEVRVEAGRCGMNRVIRIRLGNPTSC